MRYIFSLGQYGTCVIFSTYRMVKRKLEFGCSKTADVALYEFAKYSNAMLLIPFVEILICTSKRTVYVFLKFPSILLKVKKIFCFYFSFVGVLYSVDILILKNCSTRNNTAPLS